MKNSAIDNRLQAKHSNVMVWLSFGVMILLQVSMLVYWGSQKQGYHIDEIFSYQNSNGYYSHKIHNASGFSDTWQTSDYFLGSLYSHDDQRFSYGTVALNVTTDSYSHPPLFHFALHTISSLFPGTFSPWLGIVPNIFYFVIAQVFFFLICSWFLGEKDKRLSLLPCLIWGFSAGAVSMVLLIRMYFMQIMWIMGVTYCHLHLVSNEKPVKWLLMVFLFAFLSFMTQYYSIIFLFFIAAFFVIFKLIRHGWKAALAYTVSIVGALGLMVICWPNSITRGIVNGQRGKQAISNFISSSLTLLADNLRTYFSLIDKALFNSWGGALFIAFVLLLVLTVIKKIFNITVEEDAITGKETIQIHMKRKSRQSNTMSYRSFAFLFLFVSTCATIAIIAIISPYHELRYVSFLLPFIILPFFVSVKWIFENFFKHKSIFPITMTILITLITLSSFHGDNIQFLYKEQGYYNKLIKASNCDAAVCFYDQKWRTAGSVMQFSNFPKVYCTDDENIYNLQRIIDGVDYSKGIIIYLDNVMNQNNAIHTILESTNLTEYRELYTDLYFKVYCFTI